MRRKHFALPVRVFDPPAKAVAGVGADSQPERPSVREVHARRYAKRVDLSVARGPKPNGDPIPERTEQLETFDLPWALGSGAAHSPKLNEGETPQSEHG